MMYEEVSGLRHQMFIGEGRNSVERTRLME
ncbi:hypothetical protein Pint_30894 [Pistacia integerrima]|uniref:Uncharacterized protein n=1 Tax=Pistacia integerrima TaxID=434235 RepID=A0ACC0XS83_9ROSI|nr:hypothetical protein Pint_30894 [Pistacia integerrima]